jgi:hypothetical protein
MVKNEDKPLQKESINRPTLVLATPITNLTTSINMNSSICFLGSVLPTVFVMPTQRAPFSSA